MFPTREAKRNIGLVALAITFIFLATAAIQIAVIPLILKHAPDFANHYLFNWLLSSIPMYAIAMPLSLLFFATCSTKKAPQKKKLTAWNFVCIFSLCFAGTYVFNFLGTTVNKLFSELLGREAVNPIELITAQSPMWANLLFLVLLAPVFEEIFLRKLVIDRLLPYGELPAILISGVAFGLVHGNFNQLFYAIAVGMIFATVYLHTGSILYTIGMHMLLNLIGGVYTAEAIKLSNGAALPGIFSAIPGEIVGALMKYLYMIFLLLTVVVSVIAIKEIVAKRPTLERPNPSPTPRDWIHILALNPFVWIFLAVTALMFVL